MHRIDSTNVEADKFGAGKDGFTDGDPGVTAATDTTEDWFDGVQEEICNVIEKNGGTLVKGTRDQLYDILRAPVGEAGGGTAIDATGGTTDGTALRGVGGSGNGKGVEGVGTGSGSGVKGIGGATNLSSGLFGDGANSAATNARGVSGTGKNTGNGGYFIGGTTGSGVAGIGGSTNDNSGVFGDGASSAATNSRGVTGTGKGTGYGVKGTGGMTGGGVEGIGGATSGVGVKGIGGASGGVGVEATGTGSFPGLTAIGDVTGSGGVFTRGSNAGCIELIGAAGNPATAPDGAIWHNTSTNKLVVRLNGGNETITST